ncbi:STAS domain-containing protein [Paractinoplanes rishiriensis]|uniref:STAS domain-containing protein n=1 Tax=Paractinoplanes rishiriensis TaxID=1050105 RepID=A0A919K6X4_9ACTN|nr:anti-sigma factor antagonist [Actinoplanes rishiriensis]GIF02077.1 hypothetical protein Ari01nite_95410 [Actinoplanes rishiriensis]
MADMTLNFTVKRNTTVMSVRGTIDAARCPLLLDGFHAARELRRRGPIVIDLAHVDRLAAVSLFALREAVSEADRDGRPVTVRNLNLSVVDDPRSLLLRHTMCAHVRGEESPAPPGTFGPSAGDLGA